MNTSVPFAIISSVNPIMSEVTRYVIIYEAITSNFVGEFVSTLNFSPPDLAVARRTTKTTSSKPPILATFKDERIKSEPEHTINSKSKLVVLALYRSAVQEHFSTCVERNGNLLA